MGSERASLYIITLYQYFAQGDTFEPSDARRRRRYVNVQPGKVLSRELCDKRSGFVIDGDEGRLVELNTAPWNKCFRASVLKSMRNLTNPPTVLDDMAFHLLAYMDMHGRVVFTPKPLVHYMVREGSIINTG